MKRLITWLLTLCLLAALMPTFALAEDFVASGSCGARQDIAPITWTLDSSGTLTFRGKGEMRNFWTDKAPWYGMRDRIKTVIVQDGITNIGSYAFRDCANLTRVELARSVTSIPGGLFNDTPIFKNESNWENGVLYVGTALIAVKGSVAGTFTVKPGTTVIGERAFFFADMTGVSLPDSLISICCNAFEQCRKLKAVSIPKSVKIIDNFAFAYCTELKNVTIPDTVERIGECAFVGSGIYTDKSYWQGDVLYIGTNLIVIAPDITLKDYTVRAGTKLIADRAFYHSKTYAVNFPAGIKYLGNDTFYANGLTSAVIPEGTVGIGHQTFAFNRGMTSVTIPLSVKTIAEGAFQETALTDVYYAGSPEDWAEVWIDTYGGFNDSLLNATVHFAKPSEKTPSSWAASDVDAAIRAGIVPESLRSGYTRTATRAEFCALATALYESVKGPIAERTSFSDTTDVNVEKMAALSVVYGVGEGRFDPDGKLTREQAATMLARLAGAMGKPIAEKAPDFADSGTIAGWASAAVGQMQVSGVMNGTGNNAFSPKLEYSREQSIVTMLRLLAYING